MPVIVATKYVINPRITFLSSPLIYIDKIATYVIRIVKNHYTITICINASGYRSMSGKPKINVKKY